MRFNANFAKSVLFLIILLNGCFAGSDNPVTVGTHTKQSLKDIAQVQLWSYHTVYVDPENQKAITILNRSAMFAANVVQFLNKPPDNLSFKVNKTPVAAEYIDVDIDVSIKHPFPDMVQYNGYDVRGIFMGAASGELMYDSDLEYAVRGSDQYMLDDPTDGDGGGPDGYTRWFNASEFNIPGLFGYTHGVFAPGGYKPAATLNPYKYFADGLGPSEDAFQWLNSNPDYGVFSSGSENTRNYYIRFPNTWGTKFGYAVVANWKGTDPINDHPANGPEAMAADLEVTDSLFYVSPTEWGGELIVDFSIFGWEYQPSGIYVEAGFLDSVHGFEPDSIATGGGVNYSTYHVEIPADNLTGTEGYDYWIICEYDGFGYDTGYTAPDSKLAAFFRDEIYVSDVSYNESPVCDLTIVTQMPASGWLYPIGVEFDASGSYDPNPEDLLTFEWDFDGDEIYGEVPDDDYIGSEFNPTHFYDEEYNGVVNLRVTDPMGLEDICTTDPLEFTITTECGSMNMPSGSCNVIYGNGSGLYSVYRYNLEATHAAVPARIICGYEYSYQFCAIGVGASSTVYFSASNNPPNAIRDMVCTSTDLIIYKDSGSSNSLWTVQFDNTDGFTDMRESWGPSLPFSQGNIWRVVVDEYDNPVVLAYTPSSTGTWVIYHYDGSSWQTITLPGEIKTAAGIINYLVDFDYDPTTGYYFLVERNGTCGIFAVDNTGAIVWNDPDIWNGDAYGWSVGIEIPKDEPECHIMVMAGHDTSSGQPVYWARYNPMGGQKNTAVTMPDGSDSLRYGRGTLIYYSSQWWWFSAVYSERWGFQNIPF